MIKKTLFYVCMCLVLGVTTVAAQAVITFKTTEHNFGKFNEKQEQTYVFKFKNTGDKPLVIEQAVASCGCTVPTYTQAPISSWKKWRNQGGL